MTELEKQLYGVLKDYAEVTDPGVGMKNMSDRMGRIEFYDKVHEIRGRALVALYEFELQLSREQNQQQY